MKCWLGAILILSLASVACACPLCKDAVANNGTNSIIGGTPPAESNLSAGFNTSIFYMLAGVFGVFALVAFKMYKAVHPSRPRKPGS